MKKNFLPYLEASALIKKLNIKTQKEYLTIFTKYNMPGNPFNSYKENWINWASFLGTKSKNFVSFEECKDYAKINNIKTPVQWVKHLKEFQPNGIPSNPFKFYKEWISWPNFFGKEIDYEYLALIYLLRHIGIILLYEGPNRIAPYS